MTLREVLEKHMNDYVCIETDTNRRTIHLGSEWLDKFEANIYYNRQDLEEHIYLDEQGADDYDVYVAL